MNKTNEKTGASMRYAYPCRVKLLLNSFLRLPGSHDEFTYDDSGAVTEAIIVQPGSATTTKKKTMSLNVIVRNRSIVDSTS
uniref:Uncharacterized protein n=1 Tax=Thermosporothrix sp. COM3 TaxID=2490863 RepID=A0A455SD83_9CHLR|nr:hypothetical protein KTC_00590 [Thermosporothrix sp. COM3]